MGGRHSQAGRWLGRQEEGKEEREGAAAVGGGKRGKGKEGPGEGSCCKRGCGAGFRHPGAGVSLGAALPSEA